MPAQDPQAHAQSFAHSATVAEAPVLGLDATLAATQAPDSEAPLPRTLAHSQLDGERQVAVNAARKTITVFPKVERRAGKITLVPRQSPRYEQQRMLGEGGMGEVALAMDQDIDRPVAIKRLLEGENPHAISRFIDEVRTIGSLEHPNITPVHDVGIDELGRYFFVMKYIEGEDLDSVIEKLAEGDRMYHAEYSFSRRIDLFIDLLRAIQYTHSKGILHRDIKPANVMVGRYGEVMLTDWGIARPIGAPLSAEELQSATVDEAAPKGQLGGTEGSAIARTTGSKERASSTRVGSLIGTPAYMSPEQAAGETEELDERSDLYSACMLFLELLLLRNPLTRKKSVAEIVSAVIAEETIGGDWTFFQSEVQEVVPAELQHFLRRGLKKKPEDRWQSAEEMIQELEKIRRGEIRGQCFATHLKRHSFVWLRFVERNPVGALATLITLASVGGLSALSLVGGLIYLLSS